MAYNRRGRAPCGCEFDNGATYPCEEHMKPQYLKRTYTKAQRDGSWPKSPEVIGDVPEGETARLESGAVVTVIRHSPGSTTVRYPSERVKFQPTRPAKRGGKWVNVPHGKPRSFNRRGQVAPISPSAPLA